TEPNYGSFDYWVIKLDTTGAIEWQNAIGGSGSDLLKSINPTPDGGYILGGTSSSGISGDKTEAQKGLSDYWIIKLNTVGTIEWQTTIGGSLGDDLYVIKPTYDGGYIVGGFSDSGITGDKTEASRGFGDFWVLKLDATGIIEWQRTLGGSSNDNLRSIDLTFDNGYIIGGYTSSPVSGDITLDGNGDYDYWLIKLDSAGNLVWQNLIGGSDADKLFSVQCTSDGGILLGGESESPVSGDKTVASIYDDYWMVKVDDSGNVLWDKTIRANFFEHMSFVKQNAVGKYFMGGQSNSLVAADKTATNKGSYDYWILELSACDSVYYADLDDDGFGDNSNTVLACALPIGFVNDNTDCNDTVAEINILQTEICNVIDDNCNGLIDEGLVETITIGAGGPVTFCQGGNVLLSATYTGAATQWKKNGVDIPGANAHTFLVSTKGNYTCVSFSACDTVESTGIFVNVIKNPNATITAGGPTSFCAGGSVLLTANSGAGLSYQWYKGASLLAGATSINYLASLPGNYKCRVTKMATGCYKNSNAISVTVPCKEGEIVSDNSIKVSPNPAIEFITISLQNELQSNATFTIVDITGQLINTFTLSSNHVNIDITQLPAGLYIIQGTINNNSFAEFFIKE
ncbi:MAG TPA: T9SS type A sorting domain-containing protein, partial [Chitinophagales bacterium]|nr:T9SS type A sorting domain-containing protein [Chitinophagales bacterium]